jgi:hypothetical protein
MPHPQSKNNTVHSAAATLYISKGGKIRSFNDIRLQWRRRQGLTTAESEVPVDASSGLLQKLRSQGTGAVRTFTLQGPPKNRSVRALFDGQVEKGSEPTHVLLRVVVKRRKCKVSLVRAHNGSAQAFEQIASPELFVAPIGSRVRVEFTNGLAAEVELGEQTTCRAVSNPLDAEWTVVATAPERRQLSQAQHAKRGQEKCIKRPGSRRGRHFRRHAGPAQKAFARH